MSRGKVQPTPREASDGSSRASSKKRGARSREFDPENDEIEEILSTTLATTTLLDNLLARSPPLPTSPMPPSVLVTSIGNPGKYLNTLHSAGHLVLLQIASWRRYDAWQPFAGGEAADLKRKSFSLLKGYASGEADDEPTLWRSAAMMNVSGPAVKKAWMKWRQMYDGEGKGRLIVVHDELERELGSVTLKVDAKLSAKGHNGIKSIKASLPNVPSIRIGVGIGRPESRDPNTVANYVLKPMTAKEKQTIAEAAGRVWQLIKEIEEEIR